MCLNIREAGCICLTCRFPMCVIYFRTVLPKMFSLCLIESCVLVWSKTLSLLKGELRWFYLSMNFIYPEVPNTLRVSACLSIIYSPSGRTETWHLLPGSYILRQWINKIISAWGLRTNWGKVLQLLTCLHSCLEFQDWQDIFGLLRWVCLSTLHWSLFLQFLELILNPGRKAWHGGSWKCALLLSLSGWILHKYLLL